MRALHEYSLADWTRLRPLTHAYKTAIYRTETAIYVRRRVDGTEALTARLRERNRPALAVTIAYEAPWLIDNYLLEEEIPLIPDVTYRQSVAVLPFVNRSEDGEDASFFSEGVHGELITRMSQISDLRVISRTSVNEYRESAMNVVEIGEVLDVGAVVEGSVQRSGENVRINVQLLDARTEENLWGDIFDRDLNATNVFEIQSEIALAIADALDASLSDDEQARLEAIPTQNLSAMDAFFSGKLLVEERTAESITASIERFEQAVSYDEGFVPAWAGLAEAWLELPNYDPTADHQQVRREAATAAIRGATLGPDSPDALAVLGWHLLVHNYDWDGAEDAFRAALQVDATHAQSLHWYSHLLSWQGKHDDALAAAELALSTDPLSVLLKTNLNYAQIDARQWDEALTSGQALLTESNSASLGANLMVGSLRAHRAEDAAALLLTWATATGRDIEAATEVGELIIRALGLGEDVELPQELVDRLALGSEVQELYAAFGDPEMTIATLQDAYRYGTSFRGLLSMKINPSFDFIREDPRFVELLEGVDLAD